MADKKINSIVYVVKFTQNGFINYNGSGKKGGHNNHTFAKSRIHGKDGSPSTGYYSSRTSVNNLFIHKPLRGNVGETFDVEAFLCNLSGVLRGYVDARDGSCGLKGALRATDVELTDMDGGQITVVTEQCTSQVDKEEAKGKTKADGTMQKSTSMFSRDTTGRNVGTQILSLSQEDLIIKCSSTLGQQAFPADFDENRCVSLAAKMTEAYQAYCNENGLPFNPKWTYGKVKHTKSFQEGLAILPNPDVIEVLHHYIMAAYSTGRVESQAKGFIWVKSIQPDFVCNGEFGFRSEEGPGRPFRDGFEFHQFWMTA